MIEKINITESPEYSVGNIQHDIVEKYKPVNIGSGGESIVYAPLRDNESLDGVKSVVKVNKRSMLACIAWQHQNPNGSLEDYEIEAKENFKNQKELRAQQLADLSDYFGAEAIPNERSYFVRIPVTQEMAESISYEFGEENGALNPEDIHIKDGSEVMATATIQEFQRYFFDDSRVLSIGGGTLIENDYESEDYIRMMSALVFDQAPSEALHEAEKLIQHDQRLNELIRLAQEDPVLEKVILKFIDNAVAYSSNTGKALDLGGVNNVSVLMDEEPRVMLVDAMLNENLSVDINQLPTLWSEVAIAEQEGVRMFHHLGYIRTLNALSLKLRGTPALTLFSDIRFQHEDDVEKLSEMRKLVKMTDPEMGWLYAILQGE